jgi:hypothetical protein
MLRIMALPSRCKSPTESVRDGGWQKPNRSRLLGLSDSADGPWHPAPDRLQVGAQNPRIEVQPLERNLLKEPGARQSRRATSI